MAAKYQLITELYRRTGIAVAKNPQAWQSFLAAACRNYKCRFDEQLLIYALNTLRTRQLQEERPTEPVDELISKVAHAPTKKFKVVHCRCNEER